MRAGAIAILTLAALAILPSSLFARQSAQPSSQSTSQLSASQLSSSAAATAAENAASSPLPSPSAAESPAISSGWAPQPDTAAFKADHAAQASPAAGESPAANPSPATASAACCAGAPAEDHHASPQALSAGERAYYHTRDGSYLDPANWAVRIFKSRHQLEVYYKGEPFKDYHAVFGRSHEHGTKLYEGDRRTPEGVYVISGKHPSARWHWFLTLDYPNAVDRLRYAALRPDDLAPGARDGRVVGEGGSIGIHGTDVPMLNAGDINWTTGCISVDNRDVAQLHRMLPIGTVVIINP
jgi:L,D-transpeptidase catalytic domain